jgi:ketosteroid isomerase-like protein
MNDVARLTELTRQFVDAFRLGELAMVDEILDHRFVFTDGATGASRDRAGYLGLLTGPTPTLSFDEVAVHVFGDVAAVTGRTTRDGATFRRFVDTWVRTEDGSDWRCLHGCIWPVDP